MRAGLRRLQSTERHEKLQCKHAGKEDPTELDFEKVGPGAFRLMNIDGSHGGTGPSDLWLLDQ